MGNTFEQQNNPIDIEGAQCFKMDTAEYLFYRPEAESQDYFKQFSLSVLKMGIFQIF